MILSLECPDIINDKVNYYFDKSKLDTNRISGEIKTRLSRNMT